MRRIGGDFDNRSAQEELFRPQTGDDVPHRQLELLNRERARVAQAHERAAAADELLEPLEIGRRKLIRVLGPHRASAGRLACDRRVRRPARRAIGTRASSAMIRTSILSASGDLEILRVHERRYEKPYCSSTQRVQPSSMLPVHG